MTPHYLVGARIDGGVAYPESNAAAVEHGRPVVVIDPEDREQVERLIRAQDVSFDGVARENVTDADLLDMQAALREFANPTPPKPDEPTGLGAVVEDAKGTRWVRVRDGFNWRWRNDRLGEQTTYAYVDAVRVLSEGVTP